MLEVEDKLQKVLTETRDLMREAREKKATGTATITIDLQQGGITGAKVGLVRIVK